MYNFNEALRLAVECVRDGGLRDTDVMGNKIPETPARGMRIVRGVSTPYEVDADTVYIEVMNVYGTESRFFETTEKLTSEELPGVSMSVNEFKELKKV
jgi:hypothetical protein